PLQVFEPGQYLVAGELLGQRADLPGVVIEFLGCEDRCVLGRPQQEPAPMHPRLDLAHSRTLLIAAISPYPALPRSLRTRVLPRALRTRTLPGCLSARAPAHRRPAGAPPSFRARETRRRRRRPCRRRRTS